MDEDLIGEVKGKPGRSVWLKVAETMTTINVMVLGVYIGLFLWQAFGPSEALVTVQTRPGHSDTFRLDLKHAECYYPDESGTLSFVTDGRGNITIKTPKFHREADQATWKIVPKADFETIWKAAANGKPWASVVEIEKDDR
jgi:hypothetical protein